MLFIRGVLLKVYSPPHTRVSWLSGITSDELLKASIVVCPK